MTPSENQLSLMISMKATTPLIKELPYGSPDIVGQAELVSAPLQQKKGSHQTSTSQHSNSPTEPISHLPQAKGTIRLPLRRDLVSERKRPRRIPAVLEPENLSASVVS